MYMYNNRFCAEIHAQKFQKRGTDLYSGYDVRARLYLNRNSYENNFKIPKLAKRIIGVKCLYEKYFFDLRKCHPCRRCSNYNANSIR